jgi:carbonic anhydrase/acetyltransferase-like protein (isoleucine patch superfamily)
VSEAEKAKFLLSLSPRSKEKPMAHIYAVDGLRPVVDPSAFVHPAAVLIGDVIVGPGCYVGPGASLRGDFGRLVLEAGANLQDNCVMHGSRIRTAWSRPTATSATARSCMAAGSGATR